jgi:hypothetical protein
MNWAEACAALLEGKKVRRSLWDDSVTWELVERYQGFPMALMEIHTKTYPGANFPYKLVERRAVVTEAELRATNWEIVEVPA